MRTKFLIICSGFLFLIYGGDRICAQSNVPAELADIYFTDDDLDIDELQEIIYAYQDNPLSWETCRIRDLRALPLNEHLRARLIGLKRRRKAISDWQALVTDTLFTQAEIEALQNFISLSSKRTKSGQALNYISMKNRDETTTLQKTLLRTRYYSRSGWFAGGVVEADCDEPQIWDYRNISFHSPKLFGRLDLWGGAYRLQWGQGLLFSASLMSGRSTDISGNLHPLRSGFKNYLGADENRYLFGTALSLHLKNLNLSAFLSRHFLDATVNDSGVVTNLRSDGLHITASQNKAKDALGEVLAGLSLVYNWQGGSAGALLCTNGYSRGIAALDNRKTIRGVSFFHQQEFQDWVINGELVTLSNGSRAVIENVCVDLEKISFGAGWRYFPPDFFAPLGSPFRKFGGLPANESGFYSGLKIRLRERWWCSGYVDFFRQIQSTQTGTAPLNGMESLIGINHSSGSRGMIEIWYKTNRYYQPSAYSLPADQQVKFHVRRRFTQTFTGEIRATFRWNNSIRPLNGGQAVGIVGRIAWPGKMRLTAGTTQYFISQSDFVIYFYEPGLPSQFNLNNLTGSGQRYFLVVNRPIGAACEIAGALRWRHTSPASADDFQQELSFDFQLTIDL